MEPITTSLILGAVSFVTHMVNARRNNKALMASIEAQEKFEKEAQQKGFEEAAQCFQMLCNAKREAENEMFEAQLRLSKERHQSAMMHIAEMFVLDDWPLHVRPYVMRDDNLFDPEEDTNKKISSLIQPLQIILSPSLNRRFNQSEFYSEFSTALANYFIDYWKLSSDHPVLFYQDAWKDKFTSAEGSNLANIKEELKDIPTIVIIPQVRNESIKFKIYHWNIIDNNVSESSFSLPFDPMWIEQRNIRAFEKGLGELCNTLQLAISFMIDQYFWLTYLITPRLTSLIDTFKLSNEVSNQLYVQYSSLFAESLNSFIVSPQLDIRHLLRYCSIIDSYGNEKDCFHSLLQKISFCNDSSMSVSELIDKIPKYPSGLLSVLFSFIKQFQVHYNISNESLSFIEKLFNKQLTDEFVNETVRQITKRASASSNGVPWLKSEVEKEFFGNGYNEFVNDRISNLKRYFFSIVTACLRDAYNHWSYYKKVEYLEENLREKMKRDYYQNIRFYVNRRSCNIIEGILRNSCQKIVSSFNTSDESMIKDIISISYSILHEKYEKQINYKPQNNHWAYDSFISEYIYYVISSQTKTFFSKEDYINTSISSYTKEHLESIVSKEGRKLIEYSIESYLHHKLNFSNSEPYIPDEPTDPYDGWHGWDYVGG